MPTDPRSDAEARYDEARKPFTNSRGEVHPWAPLESIVRFIEAADALRASAPPTAPAGDSPNSLSQPIAELAARGFVRVSDPVSRPREATDAPRQERKRWIAGFPVHLDATMPPDRIELRDDDGAVLFAFRIGDGGEITEEPNDFEVAAPPPEES